MKLKTTVAVALLSVASASLVHAQTRFQGMDRDRDGVITRAEWRGSDAAFRNQDWNGDGVLSGDEVRAGARKPADYRPDISAQGGPRNHFADLDRDGDGWIRRNEWRMGDMDFNRLDLNHDNRVSAFEFRSGLDRAYRSPLQPGRRNGATQSGYDRGLSEGRQAGREDYANRHGWDLDGQTELERADSGYSSQLGALSDYQAGYRDGFRLGYREGFEQR
jgi:hypothetical protein